ncbi:CTR copper uptake transporter [Mycena alexandri]|uniref:Copper transport protein n=1 Tax=Mycena alexandri TaxID=1745969 RepID=A0AAD6T0C9_9AGAR|nr:CTR copper uptake transporter [Mycena alexandri]
MSVALLLLLPALRLVHGSANGMDMTMDDGMTLANGTMMTVLHFTPLGDTLWFKGWVPQSAGAMAGVCIGLFLLAIVDRWIAAVRAMMTAHWRDAGTRTARKDADDNKQTKRRRLRAPPFVPAHDLLRGALHTLQTAFGFAFMLAVMTFQAAFIISITVGLGFGEMLFGRYAAAAAHGH